MGLTLTVTPTLASTGESFKRFADETLPITIQKMAEDARDVMLDYLVRNAPVGDHPSGPSDSRAPGTFRDSIHAAPTEMDGSHAHIDILFEDPIVQFIVHGTAPHFIEPINARVLAWYNGAGEIQFSKHVHHPGTPANDFIDRSLTDGFSELYGMMRDTLHQAVASLGQAA